MHVGYTNINYNNYTCETLSLLFVQYFTMQKRNIYIYISLNREVLIEIMKNSFIKLIIITSTVIQLFTHEQVYLTN